MAVDLAPDSFAARVRASNPLPLGTISVGGGLLLNGVGIYVFISLAGRGLGPTAMAPLSVMWAITFFAAPGVFLPLEQELSRAVASRRARGVGAAPALRQTAIIGVGLLTAVLAVAIATLPLTYHDLFDGQVLLYVGFLLTLIGSAVAHPVRGLLSGSERFVDYSIYFGVEGLLRIVAGLALFVAGTTTAGLYGLSIGIVPFVALAAALARPRRLVQPGPPSRAGEVTASLGALLAASLLTAAMMNGGVVAIELLASDEQEGAASRFLAGLIIARVPLFLFQAVQASLLPRLAHLAGGRQWPEFRGALRRLLLVVGSIGLVATIAAWTVGPFVLTTLFGDEYALGHRDLALLALSSALFMAAVALGQSLIALSSQTHLALAWAAGILAFAGVTALGNDLFLRVELGLVLGTATVVGILGVLLTALLAREDLL
ncbi:MAG: hypothetical protein JJE52_15705 [Acidimicrobiia bacterium]|nr:hypothetical protein [Acidimicrobiia bacterium]